ncbi:DUF4159 domain-containing protein [Falsigemmobacter intermedius]|uniref:DUF4159 domain-containing protein n=1 Tax=Falsigemmobacter intermedius TaxID=1553448 RepID=A0A444MEI2_9RHOB|nr:DUF4159 domain-containing protein [Falsigemmobacter intermedius]RWY43313.1 DUF4159 domain-containing protein [Falsigemmobacter intermedius]
MWMPVNLAFTTPLLLWGLLLLPLLWWLLRALPPAPQRLRFPGIVLLEGLRDRRPEAERTPWPLMLLRMLALAALIIGLAGPVLNPEPAETAEGPLVVLIDGTYADARDWPQRLARAEAALAAAGRQGRPAALVSLSDLPPGDLVFQTADAQIARLGGLSPAPWDWGAEVAALGGKVPEGASVLWLSDGIDRPGRADLAAALRARADLRVWQSPRPLIALSSPVIAEGMVRLDLRLAEAAPGLSVTVLAIGPDPSGTPRELARETVTLGEGRSTPVSFALPAELRNRITRFEIEGQRGAASVALADDSLRRRKVALVAGREDRGGLQLLSHLHYLREALAPAADLSEGDLSDLLRAGPDVVILPDVAVVTPDEETALLSFVEKGGLLLRFAGPKLAAASFEAGDPLMPVRLRAGGRTVGGAMSWGAPRALAPFPEASPFYGLTIPEEVTVQAQVLAEPDPDLSRAAIAMLADGTPLVTRAMRGAGQVVLFHVTANSDWSGLPLSGLFVQMLERLTILSATPGTAASGIEARSFEVRRAMDGFGRLSEGTAFAAVAGADLVAARAQGATGPGLPPGIYTAPGSQLALNITGADRGFTPASWPAGQSIEGEVTTLPPQPLKGWLLLAALAALMLDIPASLWLSGRLRRFAGVALLALALPFMPQDPAAADDRRAVAATSEVVLGYIRTGDPDLDARSEAGLRGLGQVLYNRTTIEPGAPVGVDPETDELAFFPFLYWPVLADAPMPSPAAYRRLNQYLQTGGMILFDTRDGDVADFGSATPEGRTLQMIARPLQIPPLEPIAEDHVLTRTFYLLQDFPGRHAGRPVWVEAAPADAERAEGMPFRNLNDGVTPVVIGGNDWASAWATDARDVPLYPVGRGFAGERQREMAWRFGVNLIMHVLTGNYKSDQVHVPALLERLGQ